MKRSILLTALLVFVAFAASAQDVAAVSSDAPVGPRDVIDVKVFQDPSFNVRATVGDDGRISVPILGKVEVSGRTALEIEQRLKAAIEANYLAKADVTVTVVEYGNKPISVIGAVTRPGRIGVTGNITLIQAITQAGGLSAGYGPELYVLRTARNGLTEQISIDVEDLMVRGNPDLNLPLAPNDVVNVPMDTPITIYVLGEVMRPGTVTFRRSQTPTLLQALAGTGGPTDRAAKRVNIKRVVNGKSQTIQVDWRRISRGTAPDVELRDGDTVFLEQSVF